MEASRGPRGMGDQARVVLWHPDAPAV